MKNAIDFGDVNLDVLIRWYFVPVTTPAKTYVKNAAGLVKETPDIRSITLLKDGVKIVISYDDFNQIQREILRIKTDNVLYEDETAL